MLSFSPSDGSNSDLLQTIRVPVMADKKCQRAYRKVGPVSSRMICAGWDHGGMGPCVVSEVVGSRQEYIRGIMRRLFREEDSLCASLVEIY